MDEAIAFLTLQDNVAFSVALALMVMIGLVSAIGIDGDMDADGIPVLDWANPGRLPMLAYLTILLAVYALIGLGGQQAMLSLTGHTASGVLGGLAAVPAALLVSVPIGRVLSRILPRDETTAIRITELVGQRGEIEIGVSSAGSPARARFKDAHGQTHYVMVEPNDPETRIGTGAHVLLVDHDGQAGKVIEVEPRPDISFI